MQDKQPKYSITKFQWITPVVIMLFYIYMFGASWSLKAFDNDYIGSDFMPKVVTVLGFVCTMKVFLEQVGIALKERKAIIAAGGDPRIHLFDGQKHPISYYVHKYITIITLVFIAIYIWLMKPLGFILSTMIYLFAQIMLIAPSEKRKPVFILILSVLVSVALYAVFVKGFSVMLPAGILSF